MKILTISGSLRAGSSNTMLLRALEKLAPRSMSLHFYDGLGSLPHFNPDLDNETPPVVVQEFRDLLASVDGVLICSPEYAHGVPGSLKNALDWVVSSSGFVKKPVVLLSCSAGDSEYAQAQLGEILKIMEADIIIAAALSAPLIRKSLDAEGCITNADVATAVSSILTEFYSAIESEKK